MANKLVIGGAGGVGSVVLKMLVERGDRVLTSVLNEAEAAQVRAVHGDKVKIGLVDLGDAERALEQLRALISGSGALDAVAVCAAISPNGPVESTPLSLVRKTLEINAVSNVAVFQACIAALRESRGRIVFISSMAGRAALPFAGAYSMSKFALEAIADAMRREVAGQGVSISLVEPGGIRTPLMGHQVATIGDTIAKLPAQEDALYGHFYRAFAAITSESYRNTASTAEQVASVVVEALDAAEPQARYIAGEDARQLIGMIDTMSDVQADGVFAQMFAKPAA